MAELCLCLKYGSEFNRKSVSTVSAGFMNQACKMTLHYLLQDILIRHLCLNKICKKVFFNSIRRRTIFVENAMDFDKWYGDADFGVMNDFRETD